MEITASMVKELREATGAGMMDCKKALSECNGDMDEAANWLREKGIAKSAKKESRIAAEGLANIYIDGNKAVILEVNSETDFVSKNEEFKAMIDEIGNAILKGSAKTMDEALALPSAEGTIQDLIVAKVAKIGEKLSFRRFEVVEKTDADNFGSYLHMGGKIAVLVVVEGASEEVAKDVAMQSAAMKPKYVFVEDVPADVLEEEKKVLKEQAMNEGKPAEIAEKIVQGRIGKFYSEVCLVDQAFVKDPDKKVSDLLKEKGADIVRYARFEKGEGIEKREENFAEEVMKQIK